MKNAKIKTIINDMKRKKFRGSDKKLNRTEKFYAHFGWKTAEKEDGVLVMTLDKKIKYAKALKSLYKQACILTKNFPSKMIIWVILGALFLVPYFFLKDGVLFGAIDLKSILSSLPDWLNSAILNILPIVLLVAGSINAAFAVYQLLAFIIVKISSRSSLEEVYRIADALSGNVIDAPLPGNIAEESETSGILANYKLKE